jgi:hypothetical protein
MALPGNRASEGIGDLSARKPHDGSVHFFDCTKIK